jgi:hypothetical protein
MRLCIVCAVRLIIPLHVNSQLMCKCDHCEDTKHTYEMKGPYESDVLKSKSDHKKEVPS